MKTYLVLLLLFIVGCSTLQSTSEWFSFLNQEKKESIIGHGGTVRSIIEFPAPEGSISKGSFSPKIRVENTGSTESSGSVCITGLDKDTFSGFPGCDCKSFDFQAFEGEAFEPQALYWGPYRVEGSEDAVFTTVTRFDYESRAITRMCFVEECSATLLEKAEGPVGIVNFKEVYSPLEGAAHIQLQFTLDDKEKGVINKADLNGGCSKSKEDKVATVVLDDVPTLGRIDCGDFLFDEEGKAEVVCDLGEVAVTDRNGNSLFGKGFETTARISVGYSYETKDSVRFSS